MRRLTGLVAIASLLTSSSVAQAACPFCPTTKPTLGERVARSDAVILTAWDSMTEAAANRPATVTFEVLQIAKAPRTIKAGRKISVASAVKGTPGDLFLLTGRRGEVFAWDDPEPITETRYQYLAQAPPPEAADEKRLGYYLRFLEFSDPVIADDAYFEFAKAPYESVAALASRLPREKLRAWIADSETPAHRLGLYGLMLGLCGTANDAAVMERRIFNGTDDTNLGIDGVMAGYLLLKGPAGLERFETEILRDEDAADGEAYAVVQALRFLGRYGGGGISKVRVTESMRLLVERPALAEFAIRDLARWNDWSMVDRIADLFDSPALDTPSLRRGVRIAIFGYLLSCAGDPEAGPSAAAARRHLEELRPQEPALFRDAQRLIGPK